MAATLEHSDATRGGEPPGELSTHAAAEAYIGGVCFKLGPPRLIGAELEWFTACDSPAAGPAPNGSEPARHPEPARDPFTFPRPDPAAVAAALGPHAPRSLVPDSPALPLPGGSRITVEPGGQLELSSAAFPDSTELCARLRDDHRRVTELLATRGIRLIAASADPRRTPHCQLELPRYQAMRHYFGRIGPFGELMMCNTAATQISLDIGAVPAQRAARWTTLHTVGPALIAAFACSPDLAGAPPGTWASQRMRTWLHLDPARACPPVADWADPVAGYARWALDAPLLCVRRSDTSDRDTTGEDATGRNAADRAATGRATDGGDISGRATTGRDASGRATSGRAATGQDAGGRAATGGDASGRAAAGRNASDPDFTGRAAAAAGGPWSAPPEATFADWLSGALDEEIGRRPGIDDLDYHLSTLFPPVRPAGYFEVRYIDGQPGEGWSVPVRVLEALLSSPAATAEATALTTATAGRWIDASRDGLADPELRAAAVAVLELAAAHTPDPADILATARRCRTGRALPVEAGHA